MHPILSQLRALVWYAIAWSIAGGVLAQVLVTTQLVAWSNALVFALPASLVFGFIASSAYYVCRALPFGRRPAHLVLLMFGGTSLLSGLAWLCLCLVWNALTKSFELPWAGITIAPQASIILLIVGSVLYLISLLAHDVLIAFENIREVERQQAATLVLARDAELQVLRSQINPHFLFNSLNSISALTSIDAEAARAMTIELAQFFRKTLALSERTNITLQEEWQLCEHFLSIEKIRFGQKLQVECTIDTTACNAKVPAMLLQPLLENAIKHGICNISEGGTIRVTASASAPWLHISISNPLDATPSLASGNGTGLKNLRARFQHLYGDKARVEWKQDAEHFTVNITLPLDNA